MADFIETIRNEVEISIVETQIETHLKYCYKMKCLHKMVPV